MKQKGDRYGKPDKYQRKRHCKDKFCDAADYVPVCRNVVLTNTSDAEITGARLRLTFDPAFAKPYESAPVTLRPEQPVEFSPVEIVLDTEFLFSLTEKLVGNMTIEVMKG